MPRRRTCKIVSLPWCRLSGEIFSMSAREWSATSTARACAAACVTWRLAPAMFCAMASGKQQETVVEWCCFRSDGFEGANDDSWAFRSKRSERNVRRESGGNWQEAGHTPADKPARKSRGGVRLRLSLVVRRPSHWVYTLFVAGWMAAPRFAPETTLGGPRF